ncbi:hypothetical protein HELRODRAFT_160542 [Helobdella robusta]|uniref:Uncharacterized protein n=1 Tax=Helobdella robusta TaxID=6412 RepID=T1EQE3_HELRO|nr:hypothetical protein HELRODRAFT_160542 [Helobdella robusta]ESO06375.1 hypothetical protein HELRODRAFT_160542 [Helobdella robusta]
MKARHSNPGTPLISLVNMEGTRKSHIKIRTYKQLTQANYIVSTLELQLTAIGVSPLPFKRLRMNLWMSSKSWTGKWRFAYEASALKHLPVSGGVCNLKFEMFL